jgi:hypothetical protein
VEKTIPKVNSKAMLQSFVRKFVKEKYGEVSKQYKYLKVGFSMNSSEKKDREDTAQDKVVVKNENQIEISKDQIKTFKNQLLSLLENKFKVIPALILTQL